MGGTATDARRGRARKRGAARTPSVAYWIRAVGPGDHVDYEEVYLYGPTRRSDEGVVGHDLRIRPTRLGEGDYTMVVPPDNVVREPPRAPLSRPVTGAREVVSSGEGRLVSKPSYVAREPRPGRPSRRQLERDVASVVAADEVAPSKGHLAWLDDGSKEAYQQGEEVYLAPSDRPLDIHGYRQGGRWEAPLLHWYRYFDTLFRTRVSKAPSRRRS